MSPMSPVMCAPNVENPADVSPPNLIEICATLADRIPQNLAAVIYYGRADDVREIHGAAFWLTNNNSVIYNCISRVPVRRDHIMHTRDELLAHNNNTDKSCKIMPLYDAVTRLRESILKTPFYFPREHIHSMA